MATNHSIPIGVCGGPNRLDCMCGMYRDENPGQTYLNFIAHMGFNDYAGICCGYCLQECIVATRPAHSGGGAAASVAAVPAHSGGGAAASVAAVPPTGDDDMAAAIAASLSTVNLDETHRNDLAIREYLRLKSERVHTSLRKLTVLLETNMPPVSARFSDVAAFLDPLNNLTGKDGEYMDGVRETSASFLTSLLESTEFDMSFEDPEQKQRMVVLMQEFRKRLP